MGMKQVGAGGGGEAISSGDVKITEVVSLAT